MVFEDLWTALQDFILEAMRSPQIFIPLLFVYSVLVVIILPLPVEAALLPLVTTPSMYGVAAITIGSGKAVGAWLVYVFGLRIEEIIRSWSDRFKWMRKFVNGCVRFVAKTSYLGLFLLLATPFMSDTLTTYVYSLFNHQGQLLSVRYFIFTNFLAGIDRVMLLLIILLSLGINLFS